MLDLLKAHARYNRWMNERLYATCAQLDDAQRKSDQRAFFGSIHRTLNHILLADRAWLGRLTGDMERSASRDAQGQIIRITSLGQILYEDFEQLGRERARSDQDLLAWVEAQTEASVVQTFSYRTMKGEPSQSLVWWAATHMFNHQTHHRGQITTLLSQLGLDVGVTDMIAMLREESRAS